MVIVGLVAKTNEPVPVSSEITPASSDEVVAANWDSFPVVTATLVIAPVPPLTDETPVTAITNCRIEKTTNLVQGVTERR